MSSVAILSLSIFLISEEEIKLKLFLSTVIGIIEDYIKDMSNHVFIKSDMRKKNLQDNNSYALLTYGGYTMEPSGPDTITEEVKRRIPEGHYKGIFHYSVPLYKKNTLNLYNDTVHSKRYILLHAGGRYIEFTTGCVLISRESYETGNNYTSKDLRGDIEYETPTMNILKSLDILYTAIYEHHVSNGQNLHYETDLSKYISCVIRNKINSINTIAWFSSWRYATASRCGCIIDRNIRNINRYFFVRFVFY